MRARFALIAAVLAGCSAGPAATPQINNVTTVPAPPTTSLATSSWPSNGSVYTIEFEAELTGADAIGLSGTTNLPDDAIVSLAAQRATHIPGAEDFGMATAGRPEEATVTAGKFAGTLALDESAWLALVGTGPDQYVVDTVDSDLTVCARLKTGLDFDGEPLQPPAVVEIVGLNGEALAGSPQVRVVFPEFDPQTWLEAVLDVPLTVLDRVTARQGTEPDEEQMDGFCVF